MEIVRLRRDHRRDEFNCGVPSLNEFLQRYASQNDRAGISRTYVATEAGSMAVCGYTTIRVGHAECADVPEQDREHLPRYPIPVVHIARLAVDAGAGGRGLGEHLLLFALGKALAVADELGVWGVEVAAKDPGAREFYARYGFQALLDDELHLYISLKTVRKSITS